MNDNVPAVRLGEQNQRCGERAVLIQCVNTKQRGTHKARDLYTSSLFEKMRDYAELLGHDWYILSGKYGLVHPDEQLSYYDAVGISEDQAERIAEEISENYADVEIVAGQTYKSHLVPALEVRGVDVIENITGKIGSRMQQLDREKAKLENHSLC